MKKPKRSTAKKPKRPTMADRIIVLEKRVADLERRLISPRPNPIPPGVGTGQPPMWTREMVPLPFYVSPPEPNPAPTHPWGAPVIWCKP